MHYSAWFWFGWAVILLARNAAFTFVSRARNSGSLYRHMIMSVFSNGMFFVSEIFAVTAFLDIISGKAGLWWSVGAGVFYTAFTIVGSLLAHHISLVTEKGKSVVGANMRYAQIPTEEWDVVKRVIEGL